MKCLVMEQQNPDQGPQQQPLDLELVKARLQVDWELQQVRQQLANLQPQQIHTCSLLCKWWTKLWKAITMSVQTCRLLDWESLIISTQTNQWSGKMSHLLYRPADWYGNGPSGLSCQPLFLQSLYGKMV